MSCEKCKRIGESYDGKSFIPPGGSCNTIVHACSCGQKWWQYNGYYHLWRAVPDKTYATVLLSQNFEIDVGTGEVVGPGGDFD